MHGHRGIFTARFLTFIADLVFAHADHTAMRAANMEFHRDAHALAPASRYTTLALAGGGLVMGRTYSQALREHVEAVISPRNKRDHEAGEDCAGPGCWGPAFVDQFLIAMLLDPARALKEMSSVFCMPRLLDHMVSALRIRRTDTFD